MAFDVTVPQMGESVHEGTIVEWKVTEGDKVKRNQPLVEIMTDKVNVEIPAEVEGTIQKIVAKSGDVVQVGNVLCTIATEGEAPPPEKKKKEPIKAAAPKAETPKPKPSEAKPAAKAPATGKIAQMAPSVRRLARDLGLDPNELEGTGPEGRVSKEDVQAAAGGARLKEKTAPAKPGYVPPPLPTSGEERIEERMPLEGPRKLISDHMTRSRQTSAHVTTFEDCDFTALVEYRRKYKDEFFEKYGAKLTYMPFIMKAAVECLKEYPNLNASMTDAEIIYKKYYNIGMAVAKESGLIVPVIHNADRKSIIELAIEMNDLGSRARLDQLKLEEVQGGTFTLTNAGMFGATASTPIINQPQVAILGIHNITEKPVVRDGEIVIRHMMTFGLSFDHRLIDGHIAVQFLHTIIRMIENPTSLLLRLR